MAERYACFRITAWLLAPLVMLSGAPLWADGGEGSTVYRWLDAQGEVHFSDKPPPDGTDGVSTRTLTIPAPRRPADDYFSVVNQQRRMQERRLAIERERREARREARELDHRRQYDWRSWYYAPYLAYPRYGYGRHRTVRSWYSGRTGHRPPASAGVPGRLRHSVGQVNPPAVPHQRLR